MGDSDLMWLAGTTHASEQLTVEVDFKNDPLAQLLSASHRQQMLSLNVPKTNDETEFE